MRPELESGAEIELPALIVVSVDSTVWIDFPKPYWLQDSNGNERVAPGRHDWDIGILMGEFSRFQAAIGDARMEIHTENHEPFTISTDDPIYFLLRRDVEKRMLEGRNEEIYKQVGPFTIMTFADAANLFEGVTPSLDGERPFPHMFYVPKSLAQKP